MSQRTSAWPLALAFALLVTYASLYPFDAWHWDGVVPLAWLDAPWPRYWTGFDVVSNLLGYVPLGGLLTVAGWRAGWRGWSSVLAVGLSAALSTALETAQAFLPMRVPSNLDLALNTAGALVGAVLAWGLIHVGWLGHWSRLRERWFAPQAHGSLVLLALWPPALLYPAPVPFGLGQVAERLEQVLAEWLVGTPFLDWLPSAVTPAPLGLLAQALCVALGLLTPLLLAFSDIGSVVRRAITLAGVLTVGICWVSVSSALTYGPDHVGSWWSVPVLLGVGLAALGGLGALVLPRRLCLVVMLLCLAVSLSLLNRAPASPYFAESVEVWEQGRFIRFHGLTQWLGWVWPFAVLVFGLRAVARPVPR